MPGTAPPYVSGYEGQVTVDAEALPISNLDFTHMIGSTDATNALGAGPSRSWTSRSPASRRSRPRRPTSTPA
jgi:hypothetical protein